MSGSVNMFGFRSSLLIACVVLLGAVVSFSEANRRSASEHFTLYDDESDYDYRLPTSTATQRDPAGESLNPPVYRPYPQRPVGPPKDPNLLVVPRLGVVRGKVAYKTIKNRSINAFLGLKYGVVGSGLGRFQKATVPQSTSNEIIDATREPANCPQFPDLQQITENESRGGNVDDCLTLNVYMPNTTNSLNLYPVMVYIHGEMLFDGSAQEGQPDYFMEQDVVLVSVNYRLAPFGFLTTLSEEMPGNVALADIQMALEWVQQYIRFFGGDSQRVTLFGQAGGATLVHALSLSGKAKGLYHKLILQSGTALNPYFLDTDPLMTTRTFARLARCPPGNRGVESLNSCFERLSTTELLNVFKKHWEENEPRGLRFTGGFKLVVGDKLGYLTSHPAALVAENTYDLLAGVTKDAGAFVMSRFYNQLAQVRTRNITDYINVVLKHTAEPRHHASWRNLAIQHIFTEEDARNPTLHGLAQGLLELVDLILYRGPIIDSIRYTSRHYATYLYCFDYRGEFHRFGHLTNPLPFEVDATLSDDSIYLFPYPEEVSQLNAEDMTVARAITTMWVNFAHDNRPNVNAGIWPAVSSEYGPYLRFTNPRDYTQSTLELDYHFGDGISLPNLYPEYFTTTTSTTSTTTTTARPYPAYPNYPNYPSNQNYPNNPYYQPQRNAYRAHETVLDDSNAAINQRHPSYPSYSQNGHNMDSNYPMVH